MNRVFDIGVALVVVAGILVLTRPGSQGPGLVSSLGSAFEGVLSAAAGATPKGRTPAATRTGK